MQVRVGTGLLPVHDPMNPKLVDAPAPRAPFQAALRAVTALPLWLTSAPQDWVTLWPAAKFQVTVQALTALPAVTVTWPWKPPVQEPETV